VVETLGDELLPGTTFADHQHGPIERRGTARPLDRVEERKALSDELFCPLHSPTVGGKSHHLARNFKLFLLAKSDFSEKFAVLAILARDLNRDRQV
jgi:hypothetical protein